MSRFYKQVNCNLCKLCKTRTQVVVSDGCIQPCATVAIGEGPGADEDKIGTPFIGRSGQLLRRYLKEFANLIPGKNIVILNTVSCRPPGNRNPEIDEIEACQNWLRINLAIINPKFLLLIGKISSSAFIKGNPQNGSWYKGTDLRRVWRSDRYRFIAMPIYHPAYILRNLGNEKEIRWVKDIKKFYRRINSSL